MKEKDISVEITRIVAMLFIITCHLLQEFDNLICKNLAQFFNIGVFMFFFISGYLYGQKEVLNIKKFYISRFKKIIIPMYIFIVVILLLNFLIKKVFNIKYLIIYLFDVQYIFGGVNGAEHLWFLTIIMICYILLPIIIKHKEHILKINNINIYIISILVAYLLSIINTKIALFLIYFTTFLIGFINSNKKKGFQYLSNALIIIIALITRLIGRKILDGTIMYDIIIVSYTQIIISISIFNIIKRLMIDTKIEHTNKIINYISNISFYIYITHYMFFVGPIRTINLTNNLLINIIITIVLSYISAIILKYIADLTLKILNKNKLKEKI